MFINETVLQNATMSNTGDNKTINYPDICRFCTMVIDPYLVPIISGLGILGNLLSILIITCTTMFLHSSSLYLISLASSDAVVLLFNTFLTQGVCFRQGMCQICIYTQYVATFWSVWLLVSFTSERFIAVVFPIRQLQIGSRQTTRGVIFGVVITGCILSAPWLYIAVFSDEMCTHRISEFVNVLITIVSYTETVLTFFVPYVIICLLNFMIARAVKRSADIQIILPPRIKRDQILFSSSTPTSIREAKRLRSQSEIRTLTRHYDKQSKVISRRTRQEISIGITRTLLLVSFVFVVCNLPLYLLQTYIKVCMAQKIYITNAVLLARQLAEYLYQTNFSLNFILYIFSSKSFRVSAKRFFFSCFRSSVKRFDNSASTRMELKILDSSSTGLNQNQGCSTN